MMGPDHEADGDTMTVLGVEIPELYVTRGFTIAIILVVTLVLMRVAGQLVRRSVAASEALPSASILVNITRIAILVIGGLTVLSALEISITPIITALGVGGLAVALALQDTLGNMFAGLQIVASKQIRPGDYLLLETTQEGTVVDIAWRTTTLRTQADNLVIVPNAKLAQAVVTNYRLPADPLAVYTEFGVVYGSDLERVERVAAEVAAEVMAELQPQLPGYEPIVRFRGFGDSQITVLVVLRTTEYGDQYLLRSEFVRRLHARFAAEDIHFPFPTRTVHLVQE
jgi:small-conductance mechanosensitive channel